MAEGAVAVELGFAKPYTQSERNGVKRVSSFTWDTDISLVGGTRLRNVVDEYGHVYSVKEFKEQVLANCPIQIFTEIGRNFT